MLSRNGTIQPVLDLKRGRPAGKSSDIVNRNDQATTANSLNNSSHFCASCMSIPFGSDATQLWKDSWRSSACLRGALIIDYGENIQEIKSGVLEECRWCTVLANATLLALNLDASYEALAELNGAYVSDSHGDEDEIIHEEETKLKNDQASRSESETDERFKRYDVLDVFDRCEISMTHLDKDAQIGEPWSIHKIAATGRHICIARGTRVCGFGRIQKHRHRVGRVFKR